MVLQSAAQLHLPAAKNILSLPSGVTCTCTQVTGEGPGAVRKTTTACPFLTAKQVRQPSSVPYAAFCGFPPGDLSRAKVDA